MAAKHTPGPWAVEPRGNLKARQFIEAGEFRIAECITLDQDANAHLIAAAPDLLQALSDLTEIADGDWRGVRSVRPTEAAGAIKQARAAIAKAEGRN